MSGQSLQFGDGRTEGAREKPGKDSGHHVAGSPGRMQLRTRSSGSATIDMDHASRVLAVNGARVRNNNAAGEHV